MITIYRNARRTIKNVPDFCGLSSDEKPMDAKNGSTFLEIDTGNIFKFDEEGKNWYEQPQSGGGSGGTTDYTQLENKPSINGITLEGNQTTEELDIIPVVDLGEVSGVAPIQITLNAEQIETMKKDNCIVSISPQVNYKAYFNKVVFSDGVILFMSFVNGDILTLLVNTIELKGLLNSYNVMQIPSPTGPDDAGKVPVVNPAGTGWLLGAGGSGGPTLFNFKTRLIADITIDQEDIPAQIVISEDMEGNPLSARGVVIQSDISTTVSYCKVGINDLPWIAGISMANNRSDRPVMYLTTGSGGAFYVSTDNGATTAVIPQGARVSYYTWGQIPEKIEKLTVPVNYEIKSGTFIKVWEVLE